MPAFMLIPLLTFSALAIIVAEQEVKEYNFLGLPTFADFKSQNQGLVLPATLFEDVFKIDYHPSGGNKDWVSSQVGQPAYTMLRRKYDVSEKGGYVTHEIRIRSETEIGATYKFVPTDPSDMSNDGSKQGFAVIDCKSGGESSATDCTLTLADNMWDYMTADKRREYKLAGADLKEVTFEATVAQPSTRARRQRARLA